MSEQEIIDRPKEANGTNGKSSGQSLTVSPKKFLVVSFESVSGDLAWQIKKEGHEVKAFIQNESDKDVYDGFVDKVDNWEQWKNWADLVVFDYVGFGEIADSLRKAGKAVVGGSVYSDKLEEDRKFAQNELKKAGINILPHWDFDNFSEAIAFIKANPGRYVFKPSGTITSYQKGILFISQEEDGKDLIEILEQNKKLWAKKLKQFQLQKMAVGVEVAVGAFFNGKDFIYPINVNFEHKKLFPGDIGPYTGEMGTLMFWSQANELFKSTLLKIKNGLANSGYVGYIDINCIVNAKGIYPLEFTTRFGYPTISIQMEGVISGWGEFFFKIARNEPAEFKTKRGFQIGVVVAVPPFPYKDKDQTYIYHDLSILFRKKNLEGVTLEDARKQVYLRLKNILLQNMYYRTDIGMGWFRDSDRLHTWGYLY